jgi:hypothetical protein
MRCLDEDPASLVDKRAAICYAAHPQAACDVMRATRRSNFAPDPAINTR